MENLLASVHSLGDVFWVVVCVGLGVLLFALLAGRCIAPVMSDIFSDCDDEFHTCSREYARRVGDIERVLYILCCVLGWETLIVGWLALKSFSSYLSRQTAARGEEPGAKARLAKSYHTFLIGNGLSLLLGIGGGILVRLSLSLLLDA